MATFNSNEALKIKQAVGRESAKLVQDGMLVGLGTGSTATCFIESLALRCKEGLKITAISSSVKSAELAKARGIPIVGMEKVSVIDLTIDGADEIDPQLRMIKGGGGALLREKIIASSSKEMVAIVDESKCVKNLGAFGLPIEIIPYCYNTTIRKLNDHGFVGALRKNKGNSFYLTDNQNYIFDIKFNPVCRDPIRANADIKSVVGVVETGFFFGIAKRVVIGYADGSTKISQSL